MNEPTTDGPELLERIAAGDRDAVGLCIERYSGLVWSLARRFLHDLADAEDAVQDVFIELWTNAHRFDPGRASEVTWISMMTRRRLIDRIRRERREPTRTSIADLDQVPSRDGRVAIEASAESRRVMQLIDAMAPDQREVIRMATWLGMTHMAIAQELKMPLGTVKSHLRRGLGRIREQLGMTGVGHGRS